MIYEDFKKDCYYKENTSKDALTDDISSKKLRRFVSLEEDIINDQVTESNNHFSKKLCLENSNLQVESSEKNKELVNIQNIPFPNGTVKITAVKGYKRTEHDITIEDVFQKESLKAAVLSAFVIDPLWVLTKIQLSSTIVIFVHQAKSDEEKEAINKLYLHIPNVSAIFPPMEGANCMHCKLQLLFYTTYLRVVIPSANLVDYDWGETGIMENSIYIQDFPRRISPFAGFSIDFERDLFHYCRTKNYPQHVLEKMKNYDFSLAKNLQFIHSIPLKAQKNTNSKDTGYISLAKAIQRLGKGRENDIKIDIMTSSLGLLNSTFLSNMYLALKGCQVVASRNTDIQDWKTCMKIHFPSMNTVSYSNGGKESAGTICFQKRYWEHVNFPKSILYDSAAVHVGCLMHHKIILVRDQTSASDFFYIGSANFSSSAWGILTQLNSKNPVILCRNWECGVVLSLNDHYSCIIETILSEASSLPNSTPWISNL
ncbi:hypothetical protein T552_01809 [Pneumocystis carinii B80]|uniref:PLD phosphodiesterase domain-containing protein n=1 Tax=Pneumocystis carinii (strain B80) TaxID=1408658 RepID=A0A0W4ZJP1_PNEC8|nr:hypothetical protein T552_01809 [Pneumocystis carinii B80]KTW28549.1 hypothetical protein T552_01809 [Pneumocystis carinii B80]